MCLYNQVETIHLIFKCSTKKIDHIRSTSLMERDIHICVPLLVPHRNLEVAWSLEATFWIDFTLKLGTKTLNQSRQSRSFKTQLQT